MKKQMKPGLDEYTSLKVSVIYFSLSALWILLSDQVVLALIKQPEILTNIQMIKGWVFVLATTFIIFVILRKEIGKYLTTEAALRKSEERYRMLFDSTNDAVFVHQPSKEGAPGKFIEVNDVACQIYGYTREELLELTPPDLAIAELRDDARRRVANMLSERYSVFEILHKSKGGQELPVEVSAHLFDFYGQPTVLSIVRDITDRKQVQEQLLQSEKNYRILAENPSNIVIRFDAEGNIIFVNRYASELFGYTIDEMLGKKSTDLIHSKNQSERSQVKSFFKDLLENPKKYRTNENENTTKEGKALWISWTNTPIYEEDGTFSGLISTGFDNTQRKQAEKERANLEDRLKQAQKMEAIGTLAGGIAHDFNNILFPLVGYAELLRDDVPGDSPLQDYIDGILNAAFRSKDLVKQILTFSRQGNQEIKPVKLQPVVTEALKLLRSSIPTSIDIQQEINPGCGVVLADSTQIHQVVMNLATNAYHAMEKTGGLLKVNLKQIRLESDPSIVTELSPGEYALLTITDTGTGIEKEVLEKIFDPYFTTKEQGKGTGLGLSVVQGIIKSYNGDIRINSEPGQGTEIRVYLPVVGRIASDIQIDRSKLEQGGTEKILLVDDEEVIVRIEQLILERLGYQVITRTGSVEALEAFKYNPDSFDLVVTDMTMPNMTGDKLAIEIKKIRPDLPIILCTGFSEKVGEDKSAMFGIDCILMKPVAMAELSNSVRIVLDRRN